MEIATETVVTHPIEVVWQALRDRLEELARFLPGIESIEQVESKRLPDGRLSVLNLWRANPQMVPKVARPFVTEKMLQWKDHATWDEDSRVISWRFETFHFDRLFDCSGENRMSSTPEGHTMLRIRGTLDVYPERIPGVPRMLARRIKPSVEKFIVGLVRPNLRNLSAGLQRLLDEQDRLG